jgi:hypothetical protein
MREKPSYATDYHFFFMPKILGICNSDVFLFIAMKIIKFTIVSVPLQCVASEKQTRQRVDLENVT